MLFRNETFGMFQAETVEHMHIIALQLTQFRNYDELALDFTAGINCLTGPNGSGKTNVLDALHYLAFTRGFRNTQDKMAVQDGESFFFIGSDIQKQGVKRSIQCNFVKGQGKKVLVNRQPLKKMSDHIGELPLVVILPADTDLINGPSADRRRFMDMLISQYSKKYLTHLIHYDRLLAQRNAQLKQFGEHRYFDQDQLDMWTTQLIPHGIAIYKERKAFVEEFLPVFEEKFKKIVSVKEKPTLRYKSHVEENSIEGWLQLLKNNQPKDQVNQYSGVGIHRDDLVFSINEASVRNFGSQGQQKTFIIALKLAQYQLLQGHTNEAPILLLDDIFDKLDENRLASIARILDREIEGQIFVTDTSIERMKEIFSHGEKEAKFFQVKEGKVEEE
jgi:DNA replication and repair protein RecF